MKLIPEQITELRKRIETLKQTIDGYSDYVSSREITSCEQSSHEVIGDTQIESQLQMNLNNYGQLIRLLTGAEYVQTRNLDTIDIGTKFRVRFDGMTTSNPVYLVETSYSLGLNSNFSSIDSPLGKNVIGKTTNDRFSYALPSRFSNTERNVISGTIEEIISDEKEYVHFLREKEKDDRMSRAVRNKLHDLRTSSNLEAQEEFARRNEISPSQKLLLVIEEERLRGATSPASVRRYEKVKALLDNATVAITPTDGTIGIGTTFEYLVTDGTTVEEKSAELINYAVSDELDDAYIERISHLGDCVFGLRENDKFRFRKGNKPMVGVITSVGKTKENSSDRPKIYQI